MYTDPVKLEIYPNYTRISGPYYFNIVDEATRFKKNGYQYAEAYKRKVWDGYTRLFNKKKAIFPSGLVQRVVKLHKKYHPELQIIIEDNRSFKSDYPKAKTIKLNGIELRPHQVASVDAMLKKKGGVLWAATNSGKTESAIALCKALDLKTVFIVKGRDLVRQTYERYCIRIDPEEVGIITSSKWDSDKKFVIASADTLSRRLTPKQKKDGTWPKNSQEKKEAVIEFLQNVDVMIIDECHNAASEGLWNVGRVCLASYRFGLSGTPFKRGDKQDLKLIGLTGEVCHKVTNKEMIDSGLSVPVEINVVQIDQPDIPNYVDYSTAYDKGVIYNEYRNRVAASIGAKRYRSGKNILFLVSRISHGHELSKELKEIGFVPHNFIWGDSNDEDRKRAIEEYVSGEIRVLIASTILDVGIDIPNIDVVILCGGGKSHIRALQRIGRGLRLGKNKDKLEVIDFADCHNKHLAKHSEVRLKAYFKEDCFTISELILDE